MRHSEGSISVDKTNFKFQAYLSNFNACIINRLDPKFPRYYLYLSPTSHHLRIRLSKFQAFNIDHALHFFVGPIACSKFVLSDVDLISTFTYHLNSAPNILVVISEIT